MRYFFIGVFLCFSSIHLLGQAFVTTWQSDFYQSFTIPGTGTGYTISWVDIQDTSSHGTVIGYGISNVSVPRISKYRISISGGSPAFNQISFYNDGRDKLKILSVEQWGNIAWSSMQYAFLGCSNLVVNATDVPDLSGVSTLSGMFKGCTSFNSDISNWNTDNITDMSLMFNEASSFNQSLDHWNTANVIYMNWMFSGATNFNQPLRSWNTSNVIAMDGMFSWALAFNQPIGNWNTTKVVFMPQMFQNAESFNQPIDTWNTANVTNMGAMFNHAFSFNQPIEAWNTSKVRYMGLMFNSDHIFNQSLRNWNTDSVKDMQGMFGYAYSFNQDISNWNTANVQNMKEMFNQATAFNQNLGHWKIGSVTDMENMLSESGLSTQNYDSTLIGWDSQAVQNNVRLWSFDLKYCTAESQRNNLIQSHGWTILGDSMDCTSYITTVKICPETNTTFISNVTGINYQWQADAGLGFTNISDNSLYYGANTDSLQISSAPSSMYGYKYRCKVNGTNSNSFTLEFSNKWTGVINHVWGNPLNWSCGATPDENTDVIIEAGNVILSINTTIRSLVIKPGVNLTIESPAILTITH